MKVTIPNPNFPSEIDELESIGHHLMDCQVRDRYDLGALDKWLMEKPDQFFAAVQRLRELMETIYPPTVIEAVNETETVKEVAA